VATSSSVDIPVGTRHRVAATGEEPLVFVEVQHGSYFGEDDIVRHDDDYGR
jgi:mannose-6-phosphate isomerase